MKVANLTESWVGYRLNILGIRVSACREKRQHMGDHWCGQVSAGSDSSEC
jgi:hypothetical protein